MNKLIFLAIYITMLIVNIALFVYMKIKAKGVADLISVIEIQNWMIYFLIMLKLISLEA